jgi:hypothetical protein
MDLLNDITEINLRDRLLIEEEKAKHKVPLKGIGIFYNLDDPEEVFGVHSNLVVRNGREVTLRKLFNLVPTYDGTEAVFNRRKICCFGVGSGGVANLGSGGVIDPFNVIEPTPADSELNTRRPFIIKTTTLSSTEASKYLGGEIVNSGGSSSTYWYKKKFTGTPTITTLSQPIAEDAYNDEYYVRVQLSIEATDVRGESINEIAIYTGVDTSASPGNFTNFRLFSRITFPTEYFAAIGNKAIGVNYYLYV